MRVRHDAGTLRLIRHAKEDGKGKSQPLLSVTLTAKVIVQASRRIPERPVDGSFQRFRLDGADFVRYAKRRSHLGQDAVGPVVDAIGRQRLHRQAAAYGSRLVWVPAGPADDAGGQIRIAIFLRICRDAVTIYRRAAEQTVCRVLFFSLLFCQRPCDHAMGKGQKFPVAGHLPQTVRADGPDDLVPILAADINAAIALLQHREQRVSGQRRIHQRHGKIHIDRSVARPGRGIVHAGHHARLGALQHALLHAQRIACHARQRQPKSLIQQRHIAGQAWEQTQRVIHVATSQYETMINALKAYVLFYACQAAGLRENVPIFICLRFMHICAIIAAGS